MADLIEEPCPKCHRKSVEVEFRFRNPWRLAIVYAILVLALVGLAKGVLPFVPASHETRLILGCIGAGLLANVLRRILEPRIAKREARFRCRLCGEERNEVAVGKVSGSQSSHP